MQYAYPPGRSLQTPSQTVSRSTAHDTHKQVRLEYGETVQNSAVARGYIQ